jgi:DNA-binding CsgD family transcriptional regulator
MEQSSVAAIDTATDLKLAVEGILNHIEHEREKEIITRRFGLYDRKETLEQIGELLGITRERVRQLEKSILTKLKSATEDGKIPEIRDIERAIVRQLSENGKAAIISDLTSSLLNGNKDYQKLISHVGFVAELAPNLTVISENDHYRHAIAIAEYGDEKSIKKKVDEVLKMIKEHGEPILTDDLYKKLDHYEHPSYVRALASISKHLATLHDKWGLVRWPTVNPKNIRDKIFVILNKNNSPMHFSDIANSIKKSSFKRKDVTTQAIHNELIKDKRFVLIGRGIYALGSWGYKKGTVADAITSVLEKADEPLHRDEIVKRVLKSRQVKETTIILNLQSRPEFKRVTKATYALVSTKAK